MTVYHYYIALDSILLACSTIAVAFAASGRLFWSTWACIWRLISTLVVLTFLLIFLGYQAVKHPKTPFPELFPPQRNDSAILLPVSCFLDPDLIERASPYAPHRHIPLGNTQLERIGQPIRTLQLPQIWLFGFFVLSLLSMLLGALIRCCKTRSRSNKTKWLVSPIFLVSLATDIFCAHHMRMLKQWTSQSGWMDNKGEEGYYSTGQLLPLVTLAVIVITALEQWRSPCGKRWANKEHNWPGG